MLRTIRAVALLAVVGCGGGRAVSRNEAVVQVANHNSATVVVYALSDGTRWRLGTVETGNEEAFSLPASIGASGDVSLMAHPIGSRVAYVSDPVLVGPGDRIRLTVENNLALSTAMPTPDS